MNENRILCRFLKGNHSILSQSEVTCTISQLFYNVNIMTVAMHNPRRLLLSGCVSKPEAVDGRGVF